MNYKKIKSPIKETEREIDLFHVPKIERIKFFNVCSKRIGLFVAPHTFL